VLKTVRLNNKVITSLVLSIILFAKIDVTFAYQKSTQLVQHDLQCGQTFSCPPELQRRIDFWVQVFREWSLEDRIFHDSRKPERIYSVINSEDPCSRKRPKGKVKSEYKRIKLHLKSMADALKNGASPESLRSRPLARLFDTLEEEDLREAADSVRCQSGNRERFEKALEQFERYQPFILATLRQNGLPEDIQYLPFVESAFNPRAYSHVGAAGLWQIMPRTGRSLGLQVGRAVDERLEPELATMAAASYFVDSIEKLTTSAVAKGTSTNPQDMNPFVITSYNYGVRGMQRGIEQVGTDYMRLLAEYKSNSFRTAVRNFYASYLAARYVAQNKHRYFPNVKGVAKPQSTTTRLKKAAMFKQLNKAFGVDKETLRELNPSLTYRVWKGALPFPRGYELHLPLRSKGWSKEIAKLAKMREPTGMDSGNRHKVRRGQTACGIANRYKVSCNRLLALNKLSRKSTIRVGQKLKIPGRSKKRYIVSETYQRGRKIIQKQANSSTISALSNQSSSGDAYQRAHKYVEEYGVDHAKARILEAELKRAREKHAAKVAEARPRNQSVDTKRSQSSSLAFSTGLQRKPSYSLVRVLAGETLGHYSDWMGGGLSKIRRLNGYSSSSRKIGFGERVKLPIISASQTQEFERKRNAFHRRVSESYYQKYRVVRTVKHTVKNGQTLWGIASNARIPMWLLHHYNPKLRSAQRGTTIKIPQVEKI